MGMGVAGLGGHDRRLAGGCGHGVDQLGGHGGRSAGGCGHGAAGLGPWRVPSRTSRRRRMEALTMWTEEIEGEKQIIFFP